MLKSKKMGGNKLTLSAKPDNYDFSLTFKTVSAFKPNRITSKFRKRSKEEVKASRNSAYSYLIP